MVGVTNNAPDVIRFVDIEPHGDGWFCLWCPKCADGGDVSRNGTLHVKYEACNSSYKICQSYTCCGKVYRRQVSD